MVTGSDEMVLNTYLLLETLEENKICEKKDVKQKLFEKRNEAAKSGKIYPMDFSKLTNGELISHSFDEIVFFNRSLGYFDTIKKKNGYVNLKEKNLDLLEKIKEDGEYFVFTEESKKFMKEYKERATKSLDEYSKRCLI